MKAIKVTVMSKKRWSVYQEKIGVTPSVAALVTFTKVPTLVTPLRKLTNINKKYYRNDVY